MFMDELKKLNNIVLLGEAGSGKTEIALSLATRHLRQEQGPASFFDMDQTKGVFRARDCRETLAASGFRLMEPTSFLDAPVVPAGVIGSLLDPRSVNIFDVGGNEVGARMIGQFHAHLRAGRTKVLYVINPYRHVAMEGQQLVDRMDRILRACRLQGVDSVIVSNPCLGEQTTMEEILAGHRLLQEELAREGCCASILAVREPLAEEARSRVREGVLALRLHIRYP
jgi:hypothetical protein